MDRSRAGIAIAVIAVVVIAGVAAWYSTSRKPTKTLMPTWTAVPAGYSA